MKRYFRRGATAALALGLCACGGRDPDLDAPIVNTTLVGLNRAVVLADDPLARVLVLESSDGELTSTELPVGQNIAALAPDVSGDGLFVLSGGVQPRRNPEDELPSLTWIDTRESPRVTTRFELRELFSALTLDPDGRWAVATGAGENFVSNPNQLLFVDLENPEREPVTKTIRSFGAAPERLRFTEPLDIPGGLRRFLIVETRQDLTLIDLENLDAPEITVQLPQTPSGAPGRSLQVVVHPGVEELPGDARLAIRLENDPNVVLAHFTPDEGAEHPFNLTLNLVDVGGPPAELAFVNTDGGLRLAALVPGRRQGALVQLDTTRVEHVSLPAAFDRLQRVAEQSAAADAGDVALLWSKSSNMVAFWSLGRTDDRAVRSVDVLNLEARVVDVLDVPGDALGHRKLLSAEGSRFFVLDLERRQSFPMLSSGNVTLTVAPDGMRAWAYAAGSSRFAKIDLDTLEPTSLELDRGVERLFDIGAGPAGERSLIAIHGSGGRAATVLNALDPDTAETRFFPGLLLRGL